MQTSTIVITPFCLVLAPVVLLLAASFTTLAVVTSVLAFAVIWIRLGFLVVEFSGGVTLDLLAWTMQKWVGTPKTHHHHSARLRSAAKVVPVVDPSYLVDHNNVRPTRRHSRHHSTSRKISRSSKKRDVWNAEFVSPGDYAGHKDFVTKDNYYLVPNLVEPKRPHGRRSRSYDYYMS